MAELYDTPLDHITSPMLRWVVALMDQYRDVRLFWHAIDFLVVLALIVAITILAIRVRRVRQTAQMQHDELTGLVNNLTKTAKSANRVYRKISAAEQNLRVQQPHHPFSAGQA